MTFKDKNGKEFGEGDSIKNSDGRVFKVIKGDFENGKYGEGPDLIADAGFSRQLLWPERAKEFELVVDSPSS